MEKYGDMIETRRASDSQIVSSENGGGNIVLKRLWHQRMDSYPMTSLQVADYTGQYGYEDGFLYFNIIPELDKCLVVWDDGKGIKHKEQDSFAYYKDGAIPEDAKAVDGVIRLCRASYHDETPWIFVLTPSFDAIQSAMPVIKSITNIRNYYTPWDRPGGGFTHLEGVHMIDSFVYAEIEIGL